MKALSIRQPWAWLIIHGGKDIENRTWTTSYRGPLLIHAAKGMTQAEYRDAVLFALDRGVCVPDWHELKRGGIIGAVDLAHTVAFSSSPWFAGNGHFGFVLRNPKPLPFHPCKGALGFFEVTL